MVRTNVEDAVTKPGFSLKDIRSIILFCLVCAVLLAFAAAAALVVVGTQLSIVTFYNAKTEQTERQTVFLSYFVLVVVVCCSTKIDIECVCVFHYHLADCASFF